MLLSLSDKHKEHLSFLSDISFDVVQEFCRISVEFLKKGINAKIYQTAAQKLSVDATTVESAVEGLMYLFTESSKFMLNDIDFQDSIVSLGFSETLRDELLRQYVENRKDIRRNLSEMSPDLPQFHNLEWRFDVQLATRSLQSQIDPRVVLKLHTKEEVEKETTILQIDPVNLLHLTQTLEEALKELKTAHCRRILRNI